MTVALLAAMLLASQQGPARPARAAPTTGSAAPTTSASKAAAKAVPVEVRAASIEYLYKQRRTVMTGDPLVTLTREDATLVCRRLTAEMDGAGQIARATCDGDVKLTRGERIVTCATATFENAAGRVTCTGNPELHDGPSIVRGDRLVYDLDEDRVTLTRASGTVMQSSARELPLGRPRP